MTDVESRVARGIAVLDHFAVDWEYRIRPERIKSIYNPSECVLCAVFGNYTVGFKRLFGEGFHGHGYRCGFSSYGDDAALTAAWQSAIRARREVPVHGEGFA